MSDTAAQPHKGPPDDEDRWRELMTRAQAGDSDAYSTLLSEVAGVIEGYLRKQFGEPFWLEDCVQEALLALHRARHTYDPARKFRPWLFTIVKHKALDTLRRLGVRARSEVTSAELVGAAPEPVRRSPDSAIDAETALGWLSADYRTALMLTKLEGRSMEDAAEIAGVSVPAMKTRVHRAIRMIQKRLEREQN